MQAAAADDFEKKEVEEENPVINDAESEDEMQAATKGDSEK